MSNILKMNIFKSYSILDSIEFIARFWVGYILISNSCVETIVPLESLGIPEPNYSILKAMWDTGFMMHVVKLIELIGGILLILNFRVPLILIALIPVLLNIYGVHIFMFNSYLTKGLGMLVVTGYLVHKHREKYIPLLKK